MITWHKKRCTKADIALAGELPFCSSCDHSTAEVDLSLYQSLSPSKPPRPNHEGLNLSWPSAVSFSTESILDRDGRDLTPQLLKMVHAPHAEEHEAYQYSSNSSFEAASISGYESLRGKSEQDIRLLRLSKGTYGDPLHGTLIIKSLDHPVFFEAISYVWADENGDSTRSSRLHIG